MSNKTEIKYPKGAELLSRRGKGNLAEPNEAFELLMEVLADSYNPETNPNGIISMGIAENTLMQKEVLEYMNSVRIDGKALTYGDAAIGSNRLRANLASFLNDYFNPLEKVQVDELVVSAGVSSIVDQVAWGTCNEGDGVLIARPGYSGFTTDLQARAKVHPVLVAFGDVDPMSVEAIAAYEHQLQKSNAAGITIKALLFTNPHNPLGKCYSVESIKAHMAFCQKHNIHFISDEIYAMSVFDTPGSETKNAFHSALSIDISGIIDSDLVHVLYGMSKDFSANGLRLGAVQTRNKALYYALMSISPCAWPSAPADLIWASMLENRVWLDNYLSESRRRLSEAYTILTAVLDKYQINYVKGGNAGFFLWCDFGFALEGVDVDGKSEGPGGEARRRKEADKALNRKMMKNGVYLANSSAFSSEVPGWYRITFSLSTEVLMLGLKRLLKVVKGVDVEGDELLGLMKERLGQTSDVKDVDKVLETVEAGISRM